MICLICQRRPAEQPQVCPACRAKTVGVLADIPGLVVDLAQHDDPTPVATGQFVWVDDGTFDSPYVHQVVSLPAGPVNVGGASKVTGTPEAPVPVSVGTLDLLAPARAGSRGPHTRGVLGLDDDQIGDLSAATVLDAWVTDWIGHRGKGEHRPEPTVPVLCRWLADRWQDACDDHPAVDEVALDLRDLHGRLRGALGLIGPFPELCDGVPCRRCDRRALYRMPGSEYIECSACPDLMTMDEYERWCGLLAASVRGRKIA